MLRVAQRRAWGTGARCRILNYVQRILRTGAPWRDLPPRCCLDRVGRSPADSAVPAFECADRILWALCEDLMARGELGWEEA